MDVHTLLCNKREQSSGSEHGIAIVGLWNNLQNCIYPGVFCFGIKRVECGFIVHVY